MGYETLVLDVDYVDLPAGDVGVYKLEFSHNDNGTKVSITDNDGVSKYVLLSHRQARQIEEHLRTAVPV